MFIPWGDDFTYGDAHLTFRSPDNLIKYFNSHITDMTLMYSTPSEYLDAIKAQDLTWPTRYDDMFPYADQNEDYWTGYFSSRALAKKMDRVSQANMHAQNKIYAMMAIKHDVTKE